MIDEDVFEMLDYLISNNQIIRKGGADCYDADFPAANEAIDYSYVHWSSSNVILHPEHPSSKVLHYCVERAKIKLAFDIDQVKMGDIVLRVLNYKARQPAKKHVDIDLFTYNLGSVCDDYLFYPTDSIHYGSFAERLDIHKATPHKFNPRSHEFSIVCFFVPHFSVVMPDGQSVADILKKNCYPG